MIYVSDFLVISPDDCRDSWSFFLPRILSGARVATTKAVPVIGHRQCWQPGPRYLPGNFGLGREVWIWRLIRQNNLGHRAIEATTCILIPYHNRLK